LKENQFFEGGTRLAWILFFYKKNIHARIAKISAQPSPFLLVLSSSGLLHVDEHCHAVE
jgi:hypothetical protein